MQEAFDKLKGVDIFSLKSYMEPTESLKVLIFTAHIKLMFLTALKVYGMDLLVQQKGMLLINH